MIFPPLAFDLNTLAGWRSLLSDPKPGGLLLQRQRHELPAPLAALIDVPQDPIWHPEGNAFIHTCLTVDAMADIVSREGITGFRRDLFLLTMVCHDLGKVSTTHLKEKDGVKRWVSPGHDVAGVPIADKFLHDLGIGPEESSWVDRLVLCHMAHCRKSFSDKSIRKLVRKLWPANLTELALVMEADCMGRGSASGPLPDHVKTGLIERAREMDLLLGPEWCILS